MWWHCVVVSLPLASRSILLPRTYQPRSRLLSLGVPELDLTQLEPVSGLIRHSFCSNLKLLWCWSETSVVLVWNCSSSDSKRHWSNFNLPDSWFELRHHWFETSSVLLWSCFTFLFEAASFAIWPEIWFLIHEGLFGKRFSLSFSPVFMAIIKLTAEQFVVFQPISSLINPIHI